MAVIYLIRHGQASFGAENYDQLSPLGLEQSRHLGSLLQARVPAPKLAISGTLLRQRQTGETCLAAMGLPPSDLAQDAGWNEYDDEDFLRVFDKRFERPAEVHAELRASGDPRSAFQALYAQAIERWAQSTDHHHYRESWPRFQERVQTALAAVAGGLGRSQAALVFTSGGVIATLASHLLGLPLERMFRINWIIANGSVTKLILGRGGIHLSTLNEHAHFEGPDSSFITYR